MVLDWLLEFVGCEIEVLVSVPGVSTCVGGLLRRVTSRPSGELDLDLGQGAEVTLNPRYVKRWGWDAGLLSLYGDDDLWIYLG